MSIARFKKYIGIALFVILSVWAVPAYAINCDSYVSDMEAGATPDLQQLVCPLIGLINTLFALLAGVFIIFIIYGAIKAQMAMGDPKAVKGARQTWTYAGIGLAVVLLSLSLIYIVASLFNVEIGGPNQWATNLWNALGDLQTFGE